MLLLFIPLPYNKQNQSNQKGLITAVAKRLQVDHYTILLIVILKFQTVIKNISMNYNSIFILSVSRTHCCSIYYIKLSKISETNILLMSKISNVINKKVK